MFRRWSVSEKNSHCVVTDEPIEDGDHTGHNAMQDYGGYLVCESVLHKEDAHTIAAAPDLLRACEGLVELMDAPDPVEVGCHCTDSDGPIICAWCAAKAAIAKAKGE